MTMRSLIIGVSLALFGQMTFGQINEGSTSTVSAVHANPEAIVLPELTIEGNPLEIFTRIVTAAGLPGGIALQDPGCSYGPRKSLNVQAGTTLREALDHFASVTDSQWQIHEGIVNMFPANGLPPLFNLHIQTFEWDKTTPAGEAVGRLVTMREVAQRIGELGLKPAQSEGGASAVCIIGDCSLKTKPKPVPQVEKDTTLLAILNRIAVGHGQAIWTYMESHCGKETAYALYVYSE